jgi:hypothetical protein
MFNAVRIMSFATSKYPVVKSTMLVHRNMYKFTCTSDDRKTYNRIDHVLNDSRWCLIVLDVRSFKVVENYTVIL